MTLYQLAQMRDDMLYQFDEITLELKEERKDRRFKEQERLQTLIDDITLLIDKANTDYSHTYTALGQLSAYRECIDMIQYHLSLLKGEID